MATSSPSNARIGRLDLSRLEVAARLEGEHLHGLIGHFRRKTRDCRLYVHKTGGWRETLHIVLNILHGLRFDNSSLDGKRLGGNGDPKLRGPGIKETSRLPGSELVVRKTEGQKPPGLPHEKLETPGVPLGIDMTGIDIVVTRPPIDAELVEPGHIAYGGLEVDPAPAVHIGEKVGRVIDPRFPSLIGFTS